MTSQFTAADAAARPHQMPARAPPPPGSLPAPPHLQHAAAHPSWLPPPPPPSQWTPPHQPHSSAIAHPSHLSPPYHHYQHQYQQHHPPQDPYYHRPYLGSNVAAHMPPPPPLPPSTASQHSVPPLPMAPSNHAEELYRSHAQTSVHGQHGQHPDAHHHGQPMQGMQTRSTQSHLPPPPMPPHAAHHHGHHLQSGGYHHHSSLAQLHGLNAAHQHQHQQHQYQHHHFSSDAAHHQQHQAHVVASAVGRVAPNGDLSQHSSVPEPTAAAVGVTNPRRGGGRGSGAAGQPALHHRHNQPPFADGPSTAGATTSRRTRGTDTAAGAHHHSTTSGADASSDGAAGDDELRGVGSRLRPMPELGVNPAVRVGGTPAPRALPPPSGPSSPERYKTQPCRHFARPSGCLLGDRCRFAHGDGELRTAAQNIAAGLTTDDALDTFIRQGGGGQAVEHHHPQPDASDVRDSRLDNMP